MREALTAQLQATPAGHPLRQFVARAAEYLLQVGLEEQVAAFLGRGRYERGTPPHGRRNGYGDHRLKAEGGPLTLRPPKVRSTPEPFQVQLPAGLAQTTPELRVLITRAYVRGLSDRDLEGLFAEVIRGSFSRSAVSRATARLQAEFDAWRTRDLSALKGGPSSSTASSMPPGAGPARPMGFGRRSRLQPNMRPYAWALLHRGWDLTLPAAEIVLGPQLGFVSPRRVRLFTRGVALRGGDGA